jgi:subtilisin family serine protease
MSGESDDKYATFSNYATSAADQNHTIAAPGVCIRSDWKGGGYNTISGTSMAATHVAAAVALCINKEGVGG